MNTNQDPKPIQRNIPGMINWRERFTEVEHADNIGATVRRIVTYFIREKVLVICMLAIVIFGTICGIYAPSLQSSAIDMIAEKKQGFFLIRYLCFLFICFTVFADCCRDYLAHGSARMW